MVPQRRTRAARLSPRPLHESIAQDYSPPRTRSPVRTRRRPPAVHSPQPVRRCRICGNLRPRRLLQRQAGRLRKLGQGWRVLGRERGAPSLLAALPEAPPLCLLPPPLRRLMTVCQLACARSGSHWRASRRRARQHALTSARPRCGNLRRVALRVAPTPLGWCPKSLRRLRRLPVTLVRPTCIQKYMAEICPLSCGVCTHLCNDTDASCGAWALAGECEVRDARRQKMEAQKRGGLP